MMSSLSTLVTSIKFQILVQQLDDEEFDTFLSKLWRRNGKNTVMQMLLWNTVSDTIPEKELIQITSTIITERDPPRRHPQPKDAIISETPSQLIGEIASFLNYSDYISFSSTNRKMFVDCNSPNRLTELHLSEFNKIDPSFCLTNYPKLLYLGLHLEQTESLNISRDSITRHCPCLQTLRLTAHRIACTYSINDFITDNEGRCQSITTLELHSFNKENALNSKQLIRLLTEFPALTHLELWYMTCEDHCDINQLKLMCPLLHNMMMAYVSGSGYAALLAAFSPKLQSLTLSNCFRGSLQFPSNSDWSKLKKLCISGPTENTIKEVLYRAMNVRFLRFGPNVSNQRWARISNDQIDKVIKKVIAGHSSLRRFVVKTSGRLNVICNSMYQVLSRIQKEKRERLDIGLQINHKDITDMEEFVCLLSKILRTLSESEIEVWRVKLEPSSNDHEKDFNPLVKAIRAFIAEYDGEGIRMKMKRRRSLLIGNWECDSQNAVAPSSK